VQLGQLVHAARHPELRVTGFREALRVLERVGVFDAATAGELGGAYDFLRRAEHVLQAVRDEQTQQLPRTETGWLRAALALGFPDGEPLKSALDQVRQTVRFHFERFLQPEGAARAPKVWESLWAAPAEAAPTDASVDPSGEPANPGAALACLGDPEAVGARLVAEREQLPESEEGRRRFEAFMPLALAACARADQPGLALERLLELVDTVRGRTVYLSLLTENPATLELLVELIEESPWVLRELRATPRLLDRLRDPRRLFSPRDRDALQGELGERLDACGADEEVAMETLREFASGERLSVGVSELRGLLPLTRSSDYLTGLAEVVLEAVLGRAWGEVHERHGPLPDVDEPARPQLLVVGYGKLGGFELGYGSDLDIVFLHPGFGSAASTGPRPLAPNGYVVRVAQKVIHQLTTRTLSGALYEVDTRLRPSGRSGLLVSSLAGFERYQQADAWTWEHQALVRARPITGPEALVEGFEAVRQRILCTQRDRSALRAEVDGMRERMSAAAGAAPEGTFRLKTDRGGIVDIEFMVQYLVLGWAAQHPELTRFRDNLRILETAADVGLLPTATADRIADAYRRLRAEQHRRLLRDDDAGAAVPAEPWQALRDEVIGLYGELLAG
jgi:glutamate-ammonia-ligase adenylyltransferase